MKSKIATIVPNANLSAIKQDDFFMVLSHQLIEDRAVNFYSARASEGKYIIVDYPAVELGDAKRENIPELFQAARRIGAQEVVLPDILWSGEANFRMAEYALSHDYRSTFKVMFVPHGKNQQEWIDYTYRAIDELNVDVIGISYRHNDLFPSRMEAVRTVIDMCSANEVEIHLLGCSKDPRLEVAVGFDSGLVRSVDSALAAIFTKHGMTADILTHGGQRPPREIDFVNDVLGGVLLEKNIAWWKNRCLYGQS